MIILYNSAFPELKSLIPESVQNKQSEIKPSTFKHLQSNNSIFHFLYPESHDGVMDLGRRMKDFGANMDVDNVNRTRKNSENSRTGLNSDREGHHGVLGNVHIKIILFRITI